jgi:hypothetical protein
MKQSFQGTLNGLLSKKNRMTGEKKVLVTEIKSLQAREKAMLRDTDMYKSKYHEKYRELLKVQNAPESEQSGGRNGEMALNHARMLRGALDKLCFHDDQEMSNHQGRTQKETEITRVQALISDVGAGTKGQHRDIVAHMRELLDESCNLEMESVSV